MKYQFLVSILALVLVMSGCASGPKVQTDFSRDVNFSTYKTFGFFDKSGTDDPNYQSLTTAYFKAAVREEMTSRGYRYSDTADLKINFHLKTEEKSDLRSNQSAFSIHVGYSGYSNGHYPWGGYGLGTQARKYTQGSVKIDVVDARKSQLVWEGALASRVKSKHKDDPKAAIAEAVSHVFQKYPYSVH